MEFSLSELCYITANKRKESRHKKLEAHLCLRKQNIWTRRVPTLKSEEAVRLPEAKVSRAIGLETLSERLCLHIR